MDFQIPDKAGRQVLSQHMIGCAAVYGLEDSPILVAGPFVAGNRHINHIGIYRFCRKKSYVSDSDLSTNREKGSAFPKP
jgi:hypothetical protein